MNIKNHPNIAPEIKKVLKKSVVCYGFKVIPCNCNRDSEKDALFAQVCHGSMDFFPHSFTAAFGRFLLPILQ